MKLVYFSLVMLFLIISITPLSFAINGTDPQPINQEETIPNFQGGYITTNSSTYNKSNLLDSHNTNKPIKHYEMYSILQDIDDAFDELSRNLDVLATQLSNIISQLTTLEQTVIDNTSSINQLDSDVYYLMNETYDVYESESFVSLMRDVYKPQWIDLFEKEFDNFTLISNYRESMLVGNTLMYDHTKTLFDKNIIRLAESKTNLANFVANWPTYDPSIEDMTQPDAISVDGIDRVNFGYKTMKGYVDQAENALIQIQSFNSTIPENLFVTGIGMMEAPWQP